MHIQNYLIKMINQNDVRDLNKQTFKLEEFNLYCDP